MSKLHQITIMVFSKQPNESSVRLSVLIVQVRVPYRVRSADKAFTNNNRSAPFKATGDPSYGILQYELLNLGRRARSSTAVLCCVRRRTKYYNALIQQVSTHLIQLRVSKSPRFEGPPQDQRRSSNNSKICYLIAYVLCSFSSFLIVCHC